MKHKGKILIVDDEDPIRVLFAETLAAEGYEVRTAVDGDDAVQQALRERFDLILMDLIMPSKDGIEAILELRVSLPTVPIIAMSGGAKEGTRNCLPLAAMIGASRTLAKPFDQPTLLEAIRSGIAPSKMLPA